MTDRRDDQSAENGGVAGGPPGGVGPDDVAAPDGAAAHDRGTDGVPPDPGTGDDTESRPLTRREMRARGISLTTEIPAIREPIDWSAEAGPVVAALRVDEARAASGRVLRASEQTGGIAVAVPASAVPVRRTLRDRVPSGTASGAPETPTEKTVTGRRPVVRAPVTAEGIRIVDETGAISAVRPAVAPAVPGVGPAKPGAVGVPGAAGARTTPIAAPGVSGPAGADAPGSPPAALGDPAAVAPSSPASPTSWESAVSVPAVVLGIEDQLEPPTGGQPITPPSVEPPAGLLGDAPTALVRTAPGDPAVDEPSHIRGLPGTVGRAKPPEATHGWAGLQEEQEAAAARQGATAGEAPANGGARRSGGGPRPTVTDGGAPEGVDVTEPAAAEASAGPDGDAASVDRDVRSADGGAADVNGAEVAARGGAAGGSAEARVGGTAGASAVGTAAPTAAEGHGETIDDAAAADRGEPAGSAELPSRLVRTIVLVMVGVAIGLLIYLLATGSLGSLFAEGPFPVGSVLGALGALDLPGTSQGVT